VADAGLAGRGLLVVVAHPDDESLACGALIARAAAAGVRVTVLSLTRGEAGPSAGDAGGGASLGQRRSRELEAAAAVLGATAVVMRDYPDGMLPWVEAGPIVADIAAAIAATAADVVVTFGADGLYWHPDHIATHERVLAAVATFGAHAPALFFATTPPGQMRAVTEAAGGRPIVPGLTDPDAFGSGAVAPTVVVPCDRFAAAKLAAIRCHASQFAESAFAALTDADAARLFDVEHFHRATIGATGASWLDAFAAPSQPGG